jgi:hypothetical protein
MKRTKVRFADLQRLLVELGFRQVPRSRGYRFEHEPSETVLLYRPYEADEFVTATDLTGTQHQLDWRGLLAPETFADRLTKTPA